MKFGFIPAVCILGLLSSACAIKEVLENPEPLTCDIEMTAARPVLGDEDSKVSYSENASHVLQGKWETGDEILAFTASGKKFSLKVSTVDAETGVAVLSLNAGDRPEAGDKVYAIYHPGSSLGQISDGKLKVDFSSQPKDKVAVLMVSESEVSASKTLVLNFRYLCSVVGVVNPKINAGVTHHIHKLVLSGHEIVSSGVVSLDGGSFSFTADAPSNFITKEVDRDPSYSGGMVSLSDPVYVAVPAGGSIERATFRRDGSSIYSYEIGKTVESGKYYLINGKDFDEISCPTASGIEIDGVGWASSNLKTSAATGGSVATGEIYRWGWPVKLYNSLVIGASTSESYYDLKPEYKGIGFGAHTAGIGYYNGTEYTKYNKTDGKTELDPVDDIVQILFPGSGWRMPSTSDWYKLIHSSDLTLESTKGIAKFIDKKGNSMQFYRSAYVCQTTDGLVSSSSAGRYWTASWPSDNDTRADYVQIGSGGTIALSANVDGATKKGNARFCGYMIRPVKGDAGDKSDEKYKGGPIYPEEPELPNLNEGKSVVGLSDWTQLNINYGNLTESNHPRLFIRNSGINDIVVNQLVNNPYLTKVHNGLINGANNYSQDSMFEDANRIQYKLDASGTRLLTQSRAILRRFGLLAYAWRVTREPKYLTHLNLIIDDLCDASRFPDWHPSHFLDVAEMAYGAAIAYDWLYNDLTEERREKLAVRIRDYALKTALAYEIRYKAGNWNQVCTGGIVSAALAIYETCPELADEVIRKMLIENAKQVREIYYPDGAFPEGPGYWEYGTTYQGVLNVALETALGTDFGLSGIDGFTTTGSYYQFIRGNAGRRFNYSDSGSEVEASIGLWYIAYQKKDPSFLYLDLQDLTDKTYRAEHYCAFAMTCAQRIGIFTSKAPTARFAYFTGKIPVLMCRSGWTNQDHYLGIKAGTADYSHAHMDVGEVVYDAYGTRWIQDPVYSTSYAEEEKIGAEILGNSGAYGDRTYWRWKIFQYKPEAHATLVVNDNIHVINGFAEFTDTYNTSTRLGGRLNLSNVLGNELASAYRTATIENDSYLQIVDELTAKSGNSAKVRFSCPTLAVPTVVDGGIELSDGTTTMILKTDAPGVTYKTWSMTPGDYHTGDTQVDAIAARQNPLEGYLCGFEYNIPAGTKLTITTTLKRK